MIDPKTLLSDEELSVQKHLLTLINETDDVDELTQRVSAYGTFCHATRQLSEGLEMRVVDKK